MIFGSSGSGDLIFLTWLPDDADAALESSIRSAYEEILRHLESDAAVVIQERVFCDLEATDAILAARSGALAHCASIQVPPTLIQGAPTRSGPFAGIHIIAVRPSDRSSVTAIRRNDRVCGLEIAGADADYLGLSDIGRALDSTADLSPGAETRDTLLLTNQLLEEHRWAFTDICRTWFYLDDILSWYDEFNAARNEVFSGLGLLNGSRPGLIPASTGIRGSNPRGHRCTLDLLAVRARPGRRISVDMLHNPLQNEAPEYGSAFSRGLGLATDHCHTLFISGTASIDEGGVTVHPEDFDRQTIRTLDNIESLLASQDAGMADICQATAFIKRREDSERFESILRDRGLEDLPLICTVDDVCRNDLLVEIDATARLQPRPPSDA